MFTVAMTTKNNLAQALEDLAAARSEVTRLEALVEDLQKREKDDMAHASDCAPNICSQTSPGSEEQQQSCHSVDCTLLANNATADGGEENMKEGMEEGQGRISNPWFKKDKSKLPEKKWRRWAGPVDF